MGQENMNPGRRSVGRGEWEGERADAASDGRTGVDNDFVPGVDMMAPPPITCNWHEKLLAALHDRCANGLTNGHELACRFHKTPAAH